MLANLYDTKYLKGDFTGGLVAGVVALPLALAFGVQSGLGATAGLYGAIALGIFAAIFGGTQTQASGPTGPMTVVSAALVASAAEMMGGLDGAMGIILLAFMAGGLIQIIFGLLNIASYVKYFPYPVVSGFMSGVGLIIIILQIFPFAGLDSAKSTMKVIQELPSLFSLANYHALLLGLITVFIYYVFPKITKAIPGALVALIVASLINYFVQWEVPVIGDIPSGLPSFRFSEMLSVSPEAFTLIIEYGIVLAVLGSIDSLLTSVIADNMTKTRHNSNRELIGQGIGNMLAAAIGGIPGAGATKGTVVNINAGGKTRLSGTIHGLFLLAVLLGLGSLAAHIPLSVLAGILIPIGVKIIDFKGLKDLLSIPRADAAVLIIVLLITTFGSLINAVGIGIALASLLFMKKAADIGEKGMEVGPVSGFEDEQPWQDELELYEAYKDKVYIKHLYGPLFFGFTSYFRDQVKQLTSDIKVVIIRMDNVPYMDQSGLYAIEESINELQAKEIKVILTGAKVQPRNLMESIDIIPDLIHPDEIFESMEDVYKYLQDKLSSKA